MSEPEVTVERLGGLVELRIVGRLAVVMSADSAANLGTLLLEAAREPKR